MKKNLFLDAPDLLGDGQIGEHQMHVWLADVVLCLRIMNRKRLRESIRISSRASPLRSPELCSPDNASCRSVQVRPSASSWASAATQNECGAIWANSGKLG